MTASSARGCDSETGRLRKVVLCPPSFFEIVEPINAIQSKYYRDGLQKPKPLVMIEQHRWLMNALLEEGVDEVVLLDPAHNLPYQHAIRDVGFVIDDTIVLSRLKEIRRRPETDAAVETLKKLKSGLKMLGPPDGFVEGGDVFVDKGRLWVGLGARTDEQGAEFLHRTFGRAYDVIPLHFDPQYTHLDTVFATLGQGHAIVYERAFEPGSLKRIQEVYTSVISLTEEEQQSGGANVLSLSPHRVISIAENCTVNERLVELGYEVRAITFSEVIKSGGSVRCDTLPLERDSTL